MNPIQKAPEALGFEGFLFVRLAGGGAYSSAGR